MDKVTEKVAIQRMKDLHRLITTIMGMAFHLISLSIQQIGTGVGAGIKGLHLLLLHPHLLLRIVTAIITTTITITSRFNLFSAQLASQEMWLMHLHNFAGLTVLLICTMTGVLTNANLAQQALYTIQQQ